MTIVGSFLFASVVLISCGGNNPKADAKVERECMCAAYILPTMEERNAAIQKCDEIYQENSNKYDDDEDGFGALWEARSDVLDDIPCPDPNDQYR